MKFIEVTDWYNEHHKILIRKDLIKAVMPIRDPVNTGSEIYLGDTPIRVNETYEELRYRLVDPLELQYMLQTSDEPIVHVCGGEKK